MPSGLPAGWICRFACWAAPLMSASTAQASLLSALGVYCGVGLLPGGPCWEQHWGLQHHCLFICWGAFVISHPTEYTVNLLKSRRQHLCSHMALNRVSPCSLRNMDVVVCWPSAVPGRELRISGVCTGLFVCLFAESCVLLNCHRGYGKL